jgi:transposase
MSWNGFLLRMQAARASDRFPGLGNGAAFRKGGHRSLARHRASSALDRRQGQAARHQRGHVYLRKILIHGARAAVLRIKRDRAPIGAWLDALASRAPKDAVVIAMANKLARIASAVLSSGNDYRPVPA